MAPPPACADGHYINGKDSVMEQVELQRHGDRADVTGHATPGDQVWVTRPKARQLRHHLWTISHAFPALFRPPRAV